jgi:hypothetical protein
MLLVLNAEAALIKDLHCLSQSGEQLHIKIKKINPTRVGDTLVDLVGAQGEHFGIGQFSQYDDLQGRQTNIKFNWPLGHLQLVETFEFCGRGGCTRLPNPKIKMKVVLGPYLGFYQCQEN